MNFFNSTFRIREDSKGLQRSQKPMKRSRARLKRTTRPMKKAGRRTKNWRAAWRFLKPELEKRGRTGCEFKFIPHECWGPIDPCHSKKRRMMKGDDIYAVSLGCRAIHNFLDLNCTHEEMELFVMRAIELGGGMIVPETRAA